MEQINFRLKNQQYLINVQRTSNRHVYLKLKKAEIFLLLPHKVKVDNIKPFLLKNLPKFIRIVEKTTNLPLIDLNNNFVYLWGQKFQIKFLINQQKLSWNLIDHFNVKELVISCSKQKIKSLKKVIDEVLKNILLQYLCLNVKKYENLMNLKVHQIRVVNKETSWGTNILKKNILSFALKLIHYPSQTIDYVIIHELVHDIFPNHAQQFWVSVEKWCPDFKNHKKVLKEFENSKQSFY